jgi:protein TonB
MHVGLLILSLHASLVVLNSDSKNVIALSLRGGEGRSSTQAQIQLPNRVNISPLATNNDASTATISTQGRPAGQNAAQQGSSSKKSSHELAERSLFFNPKPSYPLASRRLGEQGAVHLKLCVGSRGLVESVQMTQSSGYQNLDRSAIEAVKAWRFSALSTTSENVLECYQLPIHFQLES